VVTLEASQLQDDVQSVGSLKSKQNVMLRPEVAGRVVALGFADGDRVKAGQVLVQLDDALQRAEVKQSQAQVAIAAANFKRNQELVAENFVSKRVLDESDANLQVAKAQLELSCARWARTSVVAPFDGSLGLRNVNLGDYVKDGADLVGLEDTSTMMVDFKLPEKFASKLKPGLKVQVLLDAFPNRQFAATVQAIDPAIDVNGRAISIRASLPNSLGEPLINKEAGGARPNAAATNSAASNALATASVANSAQQKTSSVTIVKKNPASGAAASGANNAPKIKINAPMQKDLAQALGCAVANKTSMANNVNNANSATGANNKSGKTAKAAAPSTAKGPMPLKPGMFARVVTIFAVKENAIMVPEEAIVPQGSKQFVIRVVSPEEVPAEIMATAKAAAAAAASAAQANATNKSATPEVNQSAGSAPEAPKLVSLRQEVKLGLRKAGKVEVLEGLQVGQTVVVAGQQRLQKDVSPVRVVPSAKPEGRGGANNAGAANPAVPSSVASSAASR
jgi:membrane fusion protein (multidrug efflux system)